MDVTLLLECLHSRTNSLSNLYLTAVSFVNKRMIFCSIVCANLVFFNLFLEIPAFSLSSDLCLRKEKLL